MLVEDLGVLREAEAGEEHVNGRKAPSTASVGRPLLNLLVLLVRLVKLPVAGAPDAEGEDIDVAYRGIARGGQAFDYCNL